MAKEQADDFSDLTLIASDAQRSSLAEVFSQEYADRFSDPVIFIASKFYHPAVKSFYRREFALISRTLFVESVYRRRPRYNVEILDRFSEVSAGKLSAINTLLTTQVGRLQKICEAKNVDTRSAVYMSADQKTVPIIAMHARTFLDILKRLDQVYHLTGSANLNGALDNHQRAGTELQCRKAVRAFGSMLRNEIVYLRKESNRVFAELNGTVEDQEVRQAEAAQDVAIAAFEKGVAEDNSVNQLLQVDGENAGQIITDLTATAVASNNAARKPRAKKASEGEDAGSASPEQAALSS